MFTALLAKIKAQKMVRFVGCEPTILFVGGGVGCRNRLSRIKVLIITFFVGSAAVGGVDCEAYKTQVINDCNSLISSLQYTRSRVYDIRSMAAGWIGYSNDVYQSSFQGIMQYADNAMGSLDTNISQVNSIKSTAQALECSTSDGSCNCAEVLGNISTQLSGISDSLVAQGAKVDTINTRLNSIITITTTIRDKVANVDSNVGNMSTVLTDIKGYLESQSETLQSIFGDSYDQGIKGILANAEATTEWLDDIYTLLQGFEEPIADTAAQLYQICDYFDNYLQEAFPLWLELLRKLDPEKVSKALDNLSSSMGWGPVLDIITNRYYTSFFTAKSTLSRPIPSGAPARAQYVFAYHGDNSSGNQFNMSYKQIYPGSTTAYQNSFEGLLQIFGGTLPMALASLNNWAYIDWLDRNTNNVGSLLQDFTNQVAQGFASLTNLTAISIKPYIDELDKSPLDGQTGDYFSYLTNDYLSAFSGTNPNTNYFRRIEVLLAAMLFRDNQDSDRISKLEKDIDKVKGDKESLVDAVKPDELIGNYNLGLAMFDDMPNLPTIGAGGLPDTITIDIPKWTGWKETGSGSGSENLRIELKTEKFKGFFDFLHNFFVFVYYGVVLLFVWVAFRCLMRGVIFAYNSVQKLTIK